MNHAQNARATSELTHGHRAMLPIPLKQTLNSILRDAGLRSALSAFALTRVLILCVLLFVTNVHREGKGPEFGGQVEEVTISLREAGTIHRLGQAVEAADGIWYMNIARYGYEKEPFSLNEQHSWAFFPLYPIIVNAAARVTREFSVTAALLSNIFLFAALMILYKAAQLFGATSDAADRAVFYLAAFPTSYFFSFPFTESLFLLLTVSSFYCARREMWWRAGVSGALASATRLAGIFLLPALLILYWQQNRTRLRPQIFSLCLIPAGLLAFMLYLHSITGNALAFYDIQTAWGHHPAFFLRPLWDYVTSPMLLGSHWDFRFLNFVMVVMAFVCGAVLLKRRQWALAVYLLISVIVPLSSNFSLQSMTRYVMVIFPVFFVLASAGNSARWDQIIRAVFVALLGLMTALFALRVALAMA